MWFCITSGHGCLTKHFHHLGKLLSYDCSLCNEHLIMDPVHPTACPALRSASKQKADTERGMKECIWFELYYSFIFCVFYVYIYCVSFLPYQHCNFLFISNCLANDFVPKPFRWIKTINFIDYSNILL